VVGTNSRIPRASNLVASQLESLGVSLAEVDPLPPTTVTTRKTTQAGGGHTPVLPIHRFSPDLVATLRESLRRGEVDLEELRLTFSGMCFRDEDDIRRVLAQTISLKRAILALGTDAQHLFKRVPPRTVALLLRTWTDKQAEMPASRA
jgi:hypothetical protein